MNLTQIQTLENISIFYNVGTSKDLVQLQALVNFSAIFVDSAVEVVPGIITNIATDTNTSYNTDLLTTSITLPPIALQAVATIQSPITVVTPNSTDEPIIGGAVLNSGAYLNYTGSGDWNNFYMPNWGEVNGFGPIENVNNIFSTTGNISNNSTYDLVSGLTSATSSITNNQLSQYTSVINNATSQVASAASGLSSNFGQISNIIGLAGGVSNVLNGGINNILGSALGSVQSALGNLTGGMLGQAVGMIGQLTNISNNAAKLLEQFGKISPLKIPILSQALGYLNVFKSTASGIQNLLGGLLKLANNPAINQTMSATNFPAILGEKEKPNIAAPVAGNKNNTSPKYKATKAGPEGRVPAGSKPEAREFMLKIGFPVKKRFGNIIDKINVEVEQRTAASMILGKVDQDVTNKIADYIRKLAPKGTEVKVQRGQGRLAAVIVIIMPKTTKEEQVPGGIENTTDNNPDTASPSNAGMGAGTNAGPEGTGSDVSPETENPDVGKDGTINDGNVVVYPTNTASVTEPLANPTTPQSTSGTTTSNSQPVDPAFVNAVL